MLAFTCIQTLESSYQIHTSRDLIIAFKHIKELVLFSGNRRESSLGLTSKFNDTVKIFS